MICDKCGAQLPDGSTFCGSCGTQLGAQQQAYTQPNPNYYNNTAPVYANETPVSIANWIGTAIVQMIPLVGFIMLLVWAVSDSTPKSKSNYCKATLIVMVAGTLLSVIAVIVLFFAGISFAGIADEILYELM